MGSHSEMRLECYSGSFQDMSSRRKLSTLTRPFVYFHNSVEEEARGGETV